MTTVEAIVNFAAGLRWDEVPVETQDHLVDLVHDALAVAAAGAEAPGCRALLDLLGEWEVQAGCRVLYRQLHVSPPDAALANATLIEAWDYDDTHDQGLVHTVAPVFAAVQAVAEYSRRPIGRDEYLAACAAGVEILCRLGVASVTPLTWTRTSSLGGMAAAVAAAKVMGGSAAEIHNAAGIAYTQASGNSQTIVDAATSKKMQVGFAARSGVISALLAMRGVTGPKDILEGKHGYFRLYEPTTELVDTIAEGLGSRWELDRVTMKPFPCARDVHGSVAAALGAARGRRFEVDEIKSVEIRAPRLVVDVAGRPVLVGGPEAAVAAILSIPYTVSVALLRGAVRLDDLLEAAITAEAAQALQRLVEVRVDEALPPNDLSPVEVVIRLVDGTELVGRCDAMPGSRSWMLAHPEHIAAKHADCLSRGAMPGTQSALSAAEGLLRGAGSGNFAEDLMNCLDPGAVRQVVG